MRALQRFVAAIILLALLPTSIAAAFPLVYCIGADGHRGVEHLDDEHNHSHAGSATAEASDQQSPCVDVKLAPAAHIVRADAKIFSFAGAGAPPPLKTLPSPAAGIVNDLPRRLGYSVICAGDAPVDYLAAHRTIVLII